MLEKILELVTIVTGSVAWPIAVVVIVCLLRPHLQKLIDRLEKAETKWGNLTFSKAIDDIRARLLTIEGTVTCDESQQELDEPATEELYAPVAEVMSAWGEVESLCRQLLAKNEVHVPRTWRALGSRLKRYHLIDSEHAAVLDKLRQVRNIAAHGSPDTVSAHDAQEYVILADRVTRYLSQKIADN